VQSSSRPTFGLLIESTTFPWTVRQWEGLAYSARSLDANLIAYVGGMLYSSRFGGQANVIYDLAGGQRLDGLAIWSGGLSALSTRREMAAFCDRYRSLPLVSVEMAFPGIPSLLMDDYSGMRAVISHLVEVHGYRRIAFLRGGVMHEGVEERYRAYVDALEDYGLGFDPELVSPPSSEWDGAESMRLLLDDRHVRFDALATAGDSMLLEAMSVMTAHGIKIPDDVGVAGFDDVPEGLSIMPPLTTARPPFFEMGKRAIEMLQALNSGQSLPEREVMQVDLIVRRSCGCASPAMREAAREHEYAEPASGSIEQAFAEMRRILGNASEGLELHRLRELWEVFTAESDEHRQERFLSILYDWLGRTVAADGDVSSWPAALSAMRRFAMPWLAEQDTDARLRSEALWRHGQALITETALRQQSRRNFVFNAQQAVLQSIGQALIADFDMEALMRIVAAELPRLGIPACFLSLYSDPKAPAGEARLILAYDEKGRHELPPGGIAFPATELAPSEFWNAGHRATRLVLALNYQTEHIGFVVFELQRQEDAAVCEALHRQLSGALKGALLMQTEKLYAHELEEANKELKDSHARLFVAEKMAALGRLTAGLAHEINTPLAATRTALAEMGALIREYRASRGNPSVTEADFDAIAKELTDAQALATRAVEQAVSFVRNIKAQTSDMAHQERVRFDMGSVIEETLKDLSYALNQGKCRVSFKAAAEKIEALGLPGRLAQVLTNLVTNAIDACAPAGGGDIAITLSGGPAGAVLKVADSGGGIPQESLSKIFEPLFTTKPFGRGSGLGLTIVHDIVTLDFGGTLKVESRVGEGTAFTLRFPPA
jgi:signal transduction histidine kinase